MSCNCIHSYKVLYCNYTVGLVVIIQVLSSNPNLTYPLNASSDVSLPPSLLVSGSGPWCGAGTGGLSGVSVSAGGNCGGGGAAVDVEGWGSSGGE